MEYICFIDSGCLVNNSFSKNLSIVHKNYNFSRNYQKVSNGKKKNPKSKFLNTTALLGPSGGFFGVGSSEVLVIGVVAYFILGPKRLYQLARDIGRISAEFKNVTEEARLTFQKAVDTDVKEKKEEPETIELKKIKNLSDSSDSKLSSLNNIIDSQISTIKKKKN
jgi:Sec-independent protein translocase protein TatA